MQVNIKAEPEFLGKRSNSQALKNCGFSRYIMIVGICAAIVAVLNGQGGFLAALDGLAQVSDPTVSTTHQCRRVLHDGRLDHCTALGDPQ